MEIPERLLSILRCLSCGQHPLRYDRQESLLTCQHCQASYRIIHGVPSMLNGGPEDQDWNPWDLDRIQMMGDSYYKRAKGELAEKESSKSYATMLKEDNLYVCGDTILDIGCATGHFLRSFRNRLDPDILYTGIDVNLKYLQWGRDVYGIDHNCNFVHSDALNTPFLARSFDSVIVNLFHFFPKIDDALRESMRVAKKRVIWRTPVGVTNYIVKVVYNNSFDELKVLTPKREDFDYSLYMLYSKEYIEGLVNHLGGKVVSIKRDTNFGEFDNTALEEFKHVPATKVVNGMQINGNLVLDWHYIVIDCT